MKNASLLVLFPVVVHGALLFESNRGQTAKEAEFVGRTLSGAVFFTKSGIVLNKGNKPIQLTFPGSSPASWMPENPSGETTSYFVGRDPSKWIRGLASYKRLTRKNLYPGVDLVLYGNQDNRLEYDLVLAPGADPARIRIRASAPVDIDARSGDLIIAQTIRQHKPVIYQRPSDSERRRVEGRFKQFGKNEFGFEVDAYDRTKPLIIDPTLESREYLGGIGDDTVAAYTQSGSTIVGTTTSIDFPGAPIGSRHGTDVFCRSQGNTIILGGTGNETAAPFLARSGAYTTIAGTTDSRDLPTGDGARLAFQPEFAGGATDGFIAAMPQSSGFDQAPRVTYFGTSGEDRITAGQGSFGSNYIAIAGSTDGTNLPRGFNGDHRTPNGGFDGFVVIASWSEFFPFAVLTAGFIGGAGDDFITSMSSPFPFSEAGYYIAGETLSADFPVLNGAQIQRHGSSDGFVVRLSSANNLLTILSSTLLGGASNDRIGGLTLLASGDVAVGGTTASTDFPTRTPFQASYGGGSSDAFLSILDSSLSRQLRSTYWGGSGAEETIAVGRNRAGTAVLIGGRTTSADFPVQNALQTRYGGGVSDGFFLHVDTAAGSVLQASYYGGSGEDEISAIDGITENDLMSLAGSSNSPDLQGFAAPSILEPLRAGSKDIFVIRISSLQGFLQSRIVGAPGLVAEARLYFGQDPVVRAAGRITATSADPATVLVSFMGSADATATDTSLWTVSGNPPSSLYLECQKTGVESKVTVVVPGLQDQQIQVVCASASLELKPDELDSPIWAGRRVFPELYTGVVDPQTGLRYVWARKFIRGQSRDAVFVVSKSQVARLLDRNGNGVSQLAVNYGPSNDSFLQTYNPGEATITAETPGLPPVTKTIRVVPAGDNALNYSVAAGYSAYGWISSAYRSSIPVTGSARTLDPSRVLLSTDNATWVNEVYVGGTTGFYILGRSGTPVGSQAMIEVRQDGVSTPGIQTVQFADAEIGSRLPIQDSLTLYEGGASSAQLYLHAAGLNLLYVPTGSPRPDLTATSSNPQVVPVPAPVPLDSFGAQMLFTAVREGSSTITFQAPEGLRLDAGLRRPITIRVLKTSLSVNGGSDVNLGKDLEETIPILAPSLDGVVATCTVDRSDLVKFVVGSSLSVSQELRIGQESVRVQGLASSGVAVVSCQTPGYAPASVRVLLRPVGFIWRTPETTTGTPGSSISIPYQPAAIDPANNRPLAMQTFGVLSTAVPIPQIDNENPDVLQLDTRYWNILKSGEAILTLRQPQGFLTPAIRQKHRFTSSRFSSQSLVRIVVSGSGTVDGCDVNPCVSLRDPGARLTLTPRPSTGFRFDRWNINCPEICVLTVPATTDFPLVLTAYFVPVGTSVASGFVPLEPCRLVDTRGAAGPRGGPAIAASGTRNFSIRGVCGIPANATAYSLNVTVVPRGSLGYLTIWPGGQARPATSTLNALDGRVKANAAIVPAGATDGSIDVFATDLTDVVLDVNGYFVAGSSGDANAQFFVALPPCRILDTRLPGNGGQLAALTNRRIRLSGGSCGLPETARAFALNVTAIPKSTLGYLTLWPGNGSPRPTVSTLNAVTGSVTANMAIVPGALGDIDAFATDATDLVIDINGYFTLSPSAGTEPLQFYAFSSSCRVLDTRLADGPFGGPAMAPTAPREFGFTASNCGIPSTARAYSVSATVVPPALLGYLTIYPTGSSRPVASTLNAVDGSITSNAAIVRAGSNGGVTAFATERTHLLIDLNGYFAP